MAISIGFHDVVSDLSLARPIAPGHTTLYTLDQRRFEECLTVIQSHSSLDVARVDHSGGQKRRVFLTFDDGALSSLVYAAPALEKLGWKGHFFITTNWIGCSGFLDRRQIRDLHQRGHLIGSHSCSHPERMSSLSWSDLLREWRDNCSRLADVLGEPVMVGSVPGGFYSPKVARAAAAAGVKVLFTSEPTAAVSLMDGCRVLGRYSVRPSMPASEVAAIAAGIRLPRWKQSSAWLGRNMAKLVLGSWYLPLRRVLVQRSSVL